MSEVVVVTGMSGAGRSTAAGTFEDLGWFVIDNLPVALVSKVGELASGSAGRFDRLVLVMQGFDAALEAEVSDLKNRSSSVQVIFLDASTEALVRRYESTKRRHPGVGAENSVIEAIETERSLFAAGRGAADLVIDTSELNPHQLRDRLTSNFAEPDAEDGMRITVSSFGYKHGIPTDVDLVLDCRFLPNPHWEPELREFSGLDANVSQFVVERDITSSFLDRLDGLLMELLPAYSGEGRSYLGIAFGCTGGRHRSVAVAEEVARRLNHSDWTAGVRHRDIDR